MKVINPEYKASSELGYTTEMWDGFKNQVTTYLRSQSGETVVEVGDLRKLDPAFRDDRTWRQLVSDLGLIEIR